MSLKLPTSALYGRFTVKISRRHQIQHYTQQLAKDTSVHLRDLAILANNSGATSPGEQRQRKMQRERLQDEFTSALNSFQVSITLV